MERLALMCYRMRDLQILAWRKKFKGTLESLIYLMVTVIFIDVFFAFLWKIEVTIISKTFLGLMIYVLLCLCAARWWVSMWDWKYGE
jgi:hypothetical protein